MKSPAQSTIARVIYICICLILELSPVMAQRIIDSSALPLVKNLTLQDPLFKQICGDINTFYGAGSSTRNRPNLLLVRYQCKQGDTLYSISGRFNLSYSSLASLNRLVSPQDVTAGLELLIPNMPGLHMVPEPKSQMETLVMNRLADKQGLVYVLKTAQGDQVFTFFSGEDFTPRERLAFIGRLFQSPLTSYRISSRFGPRRNPVSQSLVRHDGLDMVAPWGSPVMAARDGVVAVTGFDSVYGKYVVLDHQGNYSTMYGHLLDYKVKKGQQVIAGETLGRLGNTGQSTGAHLHFEVLQNGKAQDPLKYIQ